jgi:ATP-dependent DNA helicase RecG
MARRLEQLARIPVTELRGVGAKKAAGLAQLDIHTVLDLLQHYPRRWIDRTRECRVEDLRVGEEAMVVVRVEEVRAQRTRNRKVMVVVEVADDTGSLRVTFFNQAWREKQLAPGTQVALFGKVDRFRGARQMTNPVVDLLGDRTGRIVPVYPQSDKAGVHTWDLAQWVAEALERAGELDDPVPRGVAERFGLIDRTTAFRTIHQPTSMRDVTHARDRLVFDELLRVQLALVLRKRQIEATSTGIVHDTSGRLVERFLANLSFPLTGAQRRVIDEIADDLARPVPMHRLLQGDVGAGKTVVAVAALLTAVQGGHQGALMAPTEVLAEQHNLAVSALLAGLEVRDETEGTLFSGGEQHRPVTAALLTNRTTAAERRRIAAGLEDGSIDLLIGTHALIQDAVTFRSLGVVVIDEQHRFGVEQRAALREKGDGAVPDVLVMTATPIPRTAAMTVYGDLDVSVLDEKPAGRSPIITTWVRDEAGLAAVWDDVRAAVAAGRQTYVVCPLVEDSPKLEAASAAAVREDLANGALAGLRLGLLHGRVPPTEKAATMQAFRNGDLDVLVATTVIEVGVDVPNATVMVVLDADRFGIAQLHQLRGRVGRGAAASACHLVTLDAVDDAEARLDALVRTDDGFALAEVDLDLRGEGTLMGDRQKGRNDLKLASLRRDRDWVLRAREVAFELLDDDPGLARSPSLAAELRAIVGDDEADYLMKS